MEPKVNALSWLTGTWAGPAFGGTMDEIYSSPSGGSILGVSRVVAEGKTIHREFIQLEEREGSLVYEVHLPKKVHTFRVGEHRSCFVEWLDLENDWPQRITYTRTDDVLDVSLEGTSRIESIRLTRV